MANTNIKLPDSSRPTGKIHFLGTHLTFEEHRDFAVRAAERGMTKSGLLRALARAEIEWGLRIPSKKASA